MQLGPLCHEFERASRQIADQYLAAANCDHWDQPHPAATRRQMSTIVVVWRITSEGDPSSVVPDACCASHTSCRRRRRSSADGGDAKRCCTRCALRTTRGSRRYPAALIVGQLPPRYVRASLGARTLTGVAHHTVLSVFPGRALALAGSVRCYLTYMRTTISTKGQIVLPAELRAADGIEAGEEFEVDRVGPDEYRLTRLTPPPNRGLVDWLRSCPEDGWFAEIESESTDSL